MTTTDSIGDEAAVPLGYRLLTGTDDRAFCERVSEALESGYKLYGSVAVTVRGNEIVVAQAVVLDDAKAYPRT